MQNEKKTQLYKYSGNIDRSSLGWEFTPSNKKGKMTYNPAEGYYADKGGKLIGPIINGVEKFKYYNLQFEAECPENCYWSVIFYNSKGDAVVSDVYANIYTNQKKYSVVVYGREDAVALQPVFQSVKGVKVSNLTIEQISEKNVGKWCDDLYKTLPPLQCSTPKNSMKLLPKTIEALHNGKPLRVVMLGDSIVNDTYNSNFPALIKHNYPNSKVKWICSVRGSTGCWYYQEEKNFQKYVTDLKPDLLIIGGISQKDDIDAIKKVIDMTKLRLDCEIALMSGPFGSEKRINKDNIFMEEERMLAKTMNIEFIDIRGAWIKYLNNCQRTMKYFYRDSVHGNDRGKQIVGRILTKHFSKKHPQDKD